MASGWVPWHSPTSMIMKRDEARWAHQRAHLEMLPDDSIIEKCLEDVILVMRRKGGTGLEC